MPRSALKGVNASVSVSFPTRIGLKSSPTWVVRDWDDDELSAGTAIRTATGRWEATFVVPKNMVIPGGEADLTVEFLGIDGAGKPHTKSVEISVIDAVDNWQDFGLIVQSDSTTIKDTAFFDTQPSSIALRLREGYGDTPITIASSSETNPTYISATRKGFAYPISLSLPAALTSHSGGWHPYQFIVEAKFPASTGKPDVLYSKPVYVMTPMIATWMTSMRRYLDKARLDDIDPSLAWIDEELIHFLTEGINYMNGLGEVTYWKLSQLPSNMHTHLVNAACFIGLNAMFQALKANAFEFQGSNTQLSFTARVEGIQVKMDELRSILDQYFLPAKQAAIRVFGIGTPPPGASLTQENNIGIIGMSIGPNVNRSRWTPGAQATPLGYRAWGGY